MDEQRKTIVATLKAVRLGQLTAEQAVAILKLAGVDSAQMLAELQPHIPPPVSSTQNPFSGDGDEDERLTVLLSDADRVARAVSVFEPEAVTDSQPMTLEFPEEAPQSGISLDTRTLLSLEGAGEGRGGSGAVVRSRLAADTPRYEIKREFARGGMGRILLSRDLDVGRDVALKELLPELVSGGTRVGTRALGSAGGSGNDEAGERFLREAKVTGQLEHPNIVPVYEIGERDDGSVYYTMKYVRGKTMAARLREIRKDEKLSDEQKSAERLKLLDAFVAMCNAIAFAHSRGVIHRDIKPENVMLGDFGETMLLDWGLARVKNQKDYAVKNRPKERNISDSLRESADASKTQDGYIIGTPAYMPPEQGRGDQEEVDEKSDIYSLGSVLYEILAGAPPYEGPTAGLVLQAMLTSPPAPIADKNRFAPPELVAVCEKAMAREKKDRFKSAMEISLQVQAFREGRNLSVYQYSARELLVRYVRRRKATVAVLAIGALLLLAGGIYAAGALIQETSLAQAARRDAIKARDTAAIALESAQRETERERELKLAQQKRRDAELRERAGTIRSLRQTIDGMRIGALTDDARERVLRYERASANLALTAAERRENRVLLASLVGSISARENLLGLLAGADTSTLPEAAGIDAASLADELTYGRILSARLAAYNGDFALSSHLLSGVTDARNQAEKQSVLEVCRRLLEAHRLAVEAALTDIRAGLSRPERPLQSPQLGDYVEQLAALRDRQTVELLADALAPYQSRAQSGGTEWNAQDYDVVRLVVRVLGRIDLPAESVPVLSRFLPVIKEPELLVECALALCETRSPEAFEPLAELGRYRFNYIWESVEKKFALVPMPISALKPQSAADFHKRSLARRARGDFDGAIEDCTHALALEPNAELLLVARGLAWRAKGDLERALTDFNAAVEQNGPQLARVLVARGNCLRRMGDLDRALADFTRAINLDSRNPTPYIARGQARHEGGDADGALADFTAALQFDPRRAQTWCHRAEVKAYMGDRNAAVVDLTTAIECNPEFAEAWTLRGIIYRQTGRFTESVRDFERAAALNVSDWRNWAWRAQSQFGNDDLVGAINSCTRAIELDARAWNAWYYRGITHLQLDSRRNATTLGQTASSQPALDNEAKTAALRNAVADIAKAHEINPIDFLVPLILAEVYTRLGDRYAELGDAQAARDAWGKCIEVAAALRRRNPFGAHYYDGTMTLAEAEASLMGARARLDAQASAASASEYLSRARAHAWLAADPAQDKKVRHLRYGLADFAAAQRMLTPAARTEHAGLIREAVEALMSALGAAQFCYDAHDLLARLDLAQTQAATLYDTACTCAKLARQFERGQVLRLGENDTQRAELELAANSLAAEERLKRRNALLDETFDLLRRAYEAGFGNHAHAQRDGDLELVHQDARWPKFAAEMEALTKARSEAGQAQQESIVAITAVAPKSLAEKCGLTPLDVIWRINEQRITSMDGAKAALLSGKAGDSVTLTLRRYRTDGDGFFVIKRGADGKAVLDAKGRPQWDFEERQVVIKRGTVRSLGLYSGNGVTGIGVGLIPAPPVADGAKR